MIVSNLCLVTVIGFNRFECLYFLSLRNKTIKIETNKLILACLITLCSLPVAAQVKLGIEAGANLSNYITDSHSNPSDSKNMKVGFQAGLTVDYEFQNHLMLMSGLFLSERVEI